MAAEDSVLAEYSQGFRANLNLAPQQRDSRLLAAVDGSLSYDTPGEMFNADDVQITDPQPRQGRAGATPDSFPSFVRRVGVFAPFEDSKWLDDVDKARELVDPTTKVMAAMMAGRYRAIDRLILQAGIGSASGMVNNTPGAASALTQTPLPAAQIVAASDVSYAHDAEIVPTNGSQYGMSVGKLIHAKQLVEESELEGEYHFAAAAEQIADLLRRTPTTSRYYSDVQALASGKIDKFLGFNFHRVNKTLFSTFVGHDGVTPVRQCMAWVEDAIIYRGRPITDARIWIRSDRRGIPQAYYSLEHGCVRRYDTPVVEVDCYEGAPY
ncbi:MAG TPA: phage capsid protein [Caulobacteraceae bacterium]|jgi:hypothetical protein